MYAIKMTPHYYDNGPAQMHPPSLLTDEDGGVQTYATEAEAQAEAERIQAEVYGAHYYLSCGEYARPVYVAVQYHTMQSKGAAATNAQNSEAKRAAAAANGKKGGRPRKTE